MLMGLLSKWNMGEREWGRLQKKNHLYIKYLEGALSVMLGTPIFFFFPKHPAADCINAQERVKVSWIRQHPICLCSPDGKRHVYSSCLPKLYVLEAAKEGKEFIICNRAMLYMCKKTHLSKMDSKSFQARLSQTKGAGERKKQGGGQENALSWVLASQKLHSESVWAGIGHQSVLYPTEVTPLSPQHQDLHPSQAMGASKPAWLSSKCFFLGWIPWINRSASL